VKRWNSETSYSQYDIVQYKNAIYRCISDNENHEPDEYGVADYWESYSDPISQVYDALWALLEDSRELCSMVDVGNRKKYSGEGTPEKEQVATADFPEIRIVPVATTPHTQRTSSTSTMLVKFRIEVASGDQRIDAGLFPIEWEIYRAMARWASVVTSLEWNEKAYVITAKATSVQDGLAPANLMRGILGWVALWECEVELFFTTADLQEDDLETS
jgi:hypothetical protein